MTYLAIIWLAASAITGCALGGYIAAAAVSAAMENGPGHNLPGTIVAAAAVLILIQSAAICSLLAWRLL